MMIDKIIKPETALERRIIADPEFVVGVKWGKPRNGHPEGEVLYHIEEVLKNVDKYAQTPEDREKLRLIAIIHDTFKYKVDKSQPKTGKNHHGYHARVFAKKYITDEGILNIIQWHDDAYNAWCKGDKGDWAKAEYKAMNLIQNLGDDVELYLDFFLCDNETGSKSGDSFDWFQDVVLHV